MPQTRTCLIVALVLSFASIGRAMFMTPEPAPVDRIIANTRAFLKDHPDRAEGWYTLGRAHYLAWTLKSQQIPVNRWKRSDGDALTNLPPDWMVSGGALFDARRAEAQRQLEAESNFRQIERGDSRYWQLVNERTEQLARAGWTPPGFDHKPFDEHATEAIKHHRKAIELDGDNALYHIGLASVLEEYAPRAADTGEPAGTADEVLRRMHTEALAEYREAYELSIKDDLKHQFRPVAGLRSLVSYNAIDGYLRLAEKLGSPPADEAVAGRMAEHKRKFDALQIGAITPIVFSFQPAATLDLLVDARRSVAFDLDGDGVAERRQWVAPGTAILTWDPHRTGRVTSGRQLFGSVTWWLFWPDGYAALAALDDNRDGELSGEELRGIAVWTDANANGQSEPGEVVPIERTGIESISVRSDASHRGGPVSTRGVRLRDGQTLPTWDWVAP